MIYVQIPTGNRTRAAVKVVNAWQKAGIPANVYTWDDETYEALKDKAELLEYGERQSFAKLQNYMAANTQWDAIICGADDLFPAGGCEKLLDIARENNGKALWIDDRCNSAQPCHPVITRGWYEQHGPEIFDEGFVHNFCDTDLWRRLGHTFVKVEGVQFHHRHWLQDERKKDKIDRIAIAAWKRDEAYFRTKHGA